MDMLRERKDLSFPEWALPVEDEHSNFFQFSVCKQVPFLQLLSATVFESHLFGDLTVHIDPSICLSAVECS